MNSKLKAQTWIHESYQSGTQVVKRYGDFAGAHFHIGHLAADTDGHGGRSDVGQELGIWLNGGDEPWWMELLSRTSPDTVITPHGCEIRATGPMVDTATPPSWGCWMEDDSDDAKILRGLMADALEKRDRAIIPPNP